MRPLSANDIIRIWETGRNQHSPDRALTILSANRREATRAQLADLTVGQRDRCLLELREKTFGSTVRGFAECPRCAKHLEFTMSVSQLRIPHKPDFAEKEMPLEFAAENTKVRFRLPNSLDLVTVAGCESVQSARSLIVQRCVREATTDGRPTPADKLPAEVVDKLAAHMAECEPQAEILLDLLCPACSHKWQVIFDIATFVWKEISMQARRLLREVHTLASAYKWREADILSMSPIRRKYYLDMVT
jgi:hypothetical protein